MCMRDFSGGIFMGNIIIVLAPLILGFVFRSGRGLFLIAGFNVLPKEEKEKYDVNALSIFMSNIMFSFTIISLIYILAKEYNLNWLHAINIIIIIILSFIIFASYFSRRFIKKQE